MKKSNVSIKDIAKRAGVSTASVSRVLSNKSGVGKETSEKIQKVINDMNYRPNINARGLAKSNTYNIGVIVPGGARGIQNSFFLSIISGISSILDKTEYNMLISITSKQNTKLLDTTIVDGILVFAPRYDEINIQQLKGLDIPVVIIGSFKEDSPFDCVYADETSGVEISIEKLFEKKHRNIALINGPSTSYKSKIYESVYKDTIKRLKLDKYILDLEEFDIEGQENKILSFLKNNSDITGVICASDNIALGLLNLAKKSNISVPKKLSIIGSDSKSGDYNDGMMGNGI